MAIDNNFIFYKSFLDFIEVYEWDDKLTSELFFALAKYWVYWIEPTEEQLNNNKILKWFMITLKPLIESQQKRREKSSRGWKNHTGNQYTRNDNKRNPSKQAQSNPVEANGTTLEANGTDIDIDIDIDKDIEIDKENKEKEIKEKEVSEEDLRKLIRKYL